MSDLDPFPEETGNAQPVRDGIGYGLLIGVGLQIVVGGGLLVLLSLVASEVYTLALVACGLSQLVYMIPAMLVARAKKRPGIMRGIALIAAVTFLLNAGCFGLLLVGSGIH